HLCDSLLSRAGVPKSIVRSRSHRLATSPDRSGHLHHSVFGGDPDAAPHMKETDMSGNHNNDDPVILHRLERLPPRPRLRQIPRSARIALTGIVIVAAVVLSAWAFLFFECSPWTRDGRISAYVIDSAAEVPGLVIDVPVHDNQFVHRGDLLYKIDPRDYEAA